MANSFDPYDAMSEVEAMVRAAGHYVCASDDLRPRVLETARIERGEQRAQRSLRHFGVFIALLGFFSTIGHDRLDQSVGFRDSVLAVISSHMPPSEHPVLRNGSWDWCMIEAFMELRRQQAEVFHANL